MKDDELGTQARYKLLKIPLLSWVFLVFPLVVPPIPIGGLMVSSAWDRFDALDVVKRARRFAGCVPPSPSPGSGWLHNAFVNLLDILSLGLRSAFLGAELTDKVMLKSYGDKAENTPKSCEMWLWKTLFLGNVFFVVSWVFYPGWVLLRFIELAERAMYDAYHVEPIVVNIDVETDNLNDPIIAMPALNLKQLLDDSRKNLVVCGVYALPLNSNETNESSEMIGLLTKHARIAANQIRQHGISVYWCNSAQSYPTHYREITEFLPIEMRVNGTWVAIKDEKTVCKATSCTEVIAMALGEEASVMAIDNMVVGEKTDDLNRVIDESRKRPVIAFIYDSSSSPGILVKNASPTFLHYIKEYNAGVFFVKFTKKDELGAELKTLNLRSPCCSMWNNGSLADNIKIGLFSNYLTVLQNIVTWLAKANPDLNPTTPEIVKHKYKNVPCYVFSQWNQVIKVSSTQPVVISCGTKMDILTASSAILEKLGCVFVDKGYKLAVSPVEKNPEPESVSRGLKALGCSDKGCFVIYKGDVISTISKKIPDIIENAWIDKGVDVLHDSRI